MLVGCYIVAALVLVAACNDKLDIQTKYPFTVETMPVPKKLKVNETAEIRCELKREGRWEDTRYTIRWFLYDGKGTLKTEDGTVLLLVIDGRQPGYSVGATLRDLQNILYEEGAVIAANLDGGSSSTLYYNGKVVNKPADLLGERMIPTAFVVK